MPAPDRIAPAQVLVLVVIWSAVVYGAAARHQPARSTLSPTARAQGCGVSLISNSLGQNFPVTNRRSVAAS